MVEFAPTVRLNLSFAPGELREVLLAPTLLHGIGSICNLALRHHDVALSGCRAVDLMEYTISSCGQFSHLPRTLQSCPPSYLLSIMYNNDHRAQLTWLEQANCRNRGQYLDSGLFSTIALRSAKVILTPRRHYETLLLATCGNTIKDFYILWRQSTVCLERTGQVRLYTGWCH
jgi:hypothetical protein